MYFYERNLRQTYIDPRMDESSKRKENEHSCAIVRSVQNETDESITKMYDRLNTTTISLALLGKTYTSGELVRKIIISLLIT